MKEQRLNPSTLPKPPAAYCQVVRKGGLVTTAGMVSQNADGEVIGEGDIEIQTRQVLENLKIALREVGASFKDIVKTTIFLSDMAYYKGMNTVFNEYFEGKTPARSTVQAGLALPSLLVEIEAIAVIDEE